MQKPKRRAYFIDLNGPAARGNLQVLSLLYPGWGLILPFYACIFSPLLWLPYFVLLYFCLSIFTNRLVITGKTIRFGHHLFGTRKTIDLKSLLLDRSPLTERRTIITFSFGEEGSSQERIETEGMEDRMKARLMAAIDNLAGQCQTPKAVRSALMQTSGNSLLKKNGDTVTMPYYSRLLLAQIREMIALYQQYFWRVWAAFFGLITIAVAPMLAAYSAQQFWIKLTHSNPDFQELNLFINAWGQLWQGFYPLFDGAAKSGSAITVYTANPTFASVLCLLAFAILSQLFLYMARPNRLTISKEGLTQSLEYCGITLMERFLAWNWIVSIELYKIGQTTPTNWKIHLRSKDTSKDILLTLGAFSSIRQRLELVAAIEKYASQIPVDADLLSAITPPSENSHTELWLSSLASAPQREKLTPLKAGQSLKSGDYLIDDTHGAGGQGLTYLAHRSGAAGDLSIAQENNDGKKSDLVIKETILPVYVDSQHRREAIEHFERDARLLQRLDHHSLVKLRDYFIEDHRAYLVLDRVPGQNLRQIVEEQGAMPPSKVLDLAKQMCDMLIYLHEQEPQVIHRDFTPENLMLGLDGQLKLIDFGVAHEVKSRTTATVVGKHAYLPPEQFRGKPTSQSDLYAMAGTLYFLLVGTDPEPLSRLNPEDDLRPANRAKEDTYGSEEEGRVLTLLSRAIEHATELDATKRTVSAMGLLSELDPGYVIKVGEATGSREIETGTEHIMERPKLPLSKGELTNG